MPSNSDGAAPTSPLTVVCLVVCCSGLKGQLAPWVHPNIYYLTTQPLFTILWDDDVSLCNIRHYTKQMTHEANTLLGIKYSSIDHLLWMFWAHSRDSWHDCNGWISQNVQFSIKVMRPEADVQWFIEALQMDYQGLKLECQWSSCITRSNLREAW